LILQDILQTAVTSS